MRAQRAGCNDHGKGEEVARMRRRRAKRKKPTSPPEESGIPWGGLIIMFTVVAWFNLLGDIIVEFARVIGEILFLTRN